MLIRCDGMLHLECRWQSDSCALLTLCGRRLGVNLVGPRPQHIRQRLQLGG